MTINKVTVLGAGTMGAQLAALFVNAGLKVKLLDIVVDKNDPNLIAKKSYDKITDKKRPLLFDLNLASHLTYGNFDDDLVNDDADLYIEAVKEDIKLSMLFGNKFYNMLKKMLYSPQIHQVFQLMRLLKHLTRRIKNDSLVYISLTHHVL